jgi:hypothetical protein
MKITKQRLKEIIREEYERSTPPGDGFGDNDDGYPPERPFPSLGDLQTEPRREGGTPEERLLNKLLIVSNIGVGEGGAAAARKLGLDGDEEVIAYLDDLLGNQMYRESGLEEYRSTGTGGQSKKDREKPARPSSDTRSSNRNYRG